jgi:hypothetical protein
VTGTKYAWTSNTTIRKHTTRVSMKITAPVAMEQGGVSRSEVGLDNIQRKCQALLKAMQKANRKLYILTFKGSYRPLNGNCGTIMKPEEFPSEFDKLLKDLESAAMYDKWLLTHDAPIQEIVSNIIHSFKAEHHQVYVRYLQSDEVADAGLFLLYSHTGISTYIVSQKCYPPCQDYICRAVGRLFARLDNGHQEYINEGNKKRNH